MCKIYQILTKIIKINIDNIFIIWYKINRVNMAGLAGGESKNLTKSMKL